MSSLARLAIVAVFVAGLSAAQGTFRRCPSATSTSTDYFAVQACAPVLACYSNQCGCAGGSYNNATMSCTIPSATATANTCSSLSPCVTAFQTCMQNAAGSASCLSSLKVGIVNVLSSGVYNGSSLDLACRANSCQFFNNSAGANCTISYPSICFLSALQSLAPGVQQYIGTLLLTGGWSFISNIVLYNKTLIACGTDCTTQFGFPTVCTSAVAGSLTLTFVVNAAATNPTLLANIAAAQALGSAWLTSLQAVFTQNGGTGTFGLAGLGSINSASSVAFAWSALLAVLLAIVA